MVTLTTTGHTDRYHHLQAARALLCPLRHVAPKASAHPQLTQPQKSMVHFRTFRSSAESQPGSATRLLTTIQYSQPVSILSQERSAPRDDTTYLFLEDRTRPEPLPEAAQVPVAVLADPTTGQPKKEPEGATADTKDEKGLESDGFEIIDLPPDTPSVQPAGTVVPEAMSAGLSLPTLPASASTPMARGKRGIYRILAIKPSVNVLPLLQNLLSPLVMGLTKSARAVRGVSLRVGLPLRGSDCRAWTVLTAGRVHNSTDNHTHTTPRHPVHPHRSDIPSAPSSAPKYNYHSVLPCELVLLNHLSRSGVGGTTKLCPLPGGTARVLGGVCPGRSGRG